MEYSVIGWTEYDNELIETGENDDKAVDAVIADLRAHQYCFSGVSHQERFCGAPVLSDGKKRLFSQRDFGAMMAIAHGERAEDYARYAFDVPKGNEVMPTKERHLYCIG